MVEQRNRGLLHDRLLRAISHLLRFRSSPRLKVWLPFLAGLAVLLLLLGFAYYDPASSYYPAHDFLDGLLPLSYLRGQDPSFFQFDAQLHGVLGSVPLSALAVNDFSIEHNMFVWFSPFVAAAVNSVLSRSVGYVGMYLLVQKTLSGHPRRRMIGMISGVFFALLPYWPGIEYTVALLPLLSVAVLNLLSNGETWRRMSWVILILSTQVMNFVYGGFVVLGLSLFAAAWALLARSDHFAVLLKVTAVLAVGYLVATARSMYLLFFTDFVSNRIEYSRPQFGWFSRTSLHEFASTTLDTLINGQYHFGSGQLGVPLLALACVLVFLGYSAIVFLLNRFVARDKVPMPSTIEGTRRRLVWMLAAFLLAIVALSAFYAAEVSGFTQFESILPVPVQVNRVICLLPLLWSMVLAVSLGILTARPQRRVGSRYSGASLLVPALLAAFLAAVVVQVAYEYPGVNGRLRSLLDRSPPPSLAEYYSMDDYSALARKLGLQPKDVKAVSLDLDPMVAAFNGYTTFDGYLSSYPLEYKRLFRKVIESELDLSPNLREYFDGWGNRVYLFNSKGPVGQLRIDWCAAATLGARYVITKRDLAQIPQLQLAGSVNGLNAYRIDALCTTG